MSHLNHLIVDDDSYFEIDPDSRSIEYIGDESLIMSQADHNSERYTFRMPRYVEGHDMSLCDIAEIHYINMSSENRAQRKIDIYTIDDMEIDPDDQNEIVFTWLVSQNATTYVGSLSFACRFQCMSGSMIDYAWGTSPFSAITIAESINNSRAIAVQYADILQEWYMELLSGNSMGSSNGVAKIDEAKNKALEDIENAKNKAINEIEAVDTIHQLESAAIANITAAGTEAVNRIDESIDRVSEAEESAISRIQTAASEIIRNIPRYAGETRDVT